MTPADVVVVGASNLDLSFRTARLPDPGETVAHAELTESLGGKGANQAVAAARFGAGVAFISSLGQDRAGAEVEQALAAEGIDSTGCAFHPGHRTGRACIWLDGAGENRILVAPGANAFLHEPAVAKSLSAIATASVVLCQLETPVAGIARAVRWARDVGARSILNAAPATPFHRLDVTPDVLVVNEHEARQLVEGDQGTPDLAPALAGRFGIDVVVVTLGAAGALLWSEGQMIATPAPQVSAIDTTAAGDAFCGALAARLAIGDDPAHAVQRACRAGALATMRPGALGALPTLEQVEEPLPGEARGKDR